MERDRHKREVKDPQMCCMPARINTILTSRLSTLAANIQLRRTFFRLNIPHICCRSLQTPLISSSGKEWKLTFLNVKHIGFQSKPGVFFVFCFFFKLQACSCQSIFSRAWQASYCQGNNHFTVWQQRQFMKRQSFKRLKPLKAQSNLVMSLLFLACIGYLGQVLVRQQMQLSWFEAVLTFTFVEEVRLEFPTGVFFCGRHDISALCRHSGGLLCQQWSCDPAVSFCVSSITTWKKLQHSDAL